MHITIASNALADALKSSVAAPKSTLPVLAQALLTTRDDGRVGFMTTDLEVYIETFAEAEIHEAGAQCLQASLMRPVVSHGGKVTIRGDVLTRDRSRYKLPAHPPGDFPRPDSADWRRVEVDPIALAHALSAVAYTVDSATPHQNFRGVMVVPGLAWGTNGQRGARCALDYDGPSLAVPGHQAQRLVDALEADSKLSVANVREGRAGLLRVDSGTGTLTLRLFEIVPFDFKRATPIPADDEPCVVLHTETARNLVRRFLPFAEVATRSGKFFGVELQRSKDDLVLCDRTGDNREDLTEAVDTASGTFRIDLNPKFLLDALTIIRTPKVRFYPRTINMLKVIPVTDEEPTDDTVELHMFAGMNP